MAEGHDLFRGVRGHVPLSPLEILKKMNKQKKKMRCNLVHCEMQSIAL